MSGFTFIVVVALARDHRAILGQAAAVTRTLLVLTEQGVHVAPGAPVARVTRAGVASCCGWRAATDAMLTWAQVAFVGLAEQTWT